VKAEDIDMILPPEGSNTESQAMMYLIFAIMSLFFGCFLLLPAFFVGLGLLIPAVGLIVIGIALLAARYYVLRRYAKRVEQLRKDAAVKVRCRYCGALSSESARRCEFCGATL